LILGTAAFKYSLDLMKSLQERKVTQSTLYLLNIHDELEKMGIKNLPKKAHYEMIFNHFVEKNMVPIGIFRNSKIINNNNNVGSNMRNNKVEKYVYMVPLKDTEVYVEHDRIYVLASEEETTNNNNNDTYKQKDNINHKNLKLIEKSNDLAGRIVVNLKDLLIFNQDCLKNNFSIKKIIDTTRKSLRKELANVHDFIEKQDESHEGEES
jgi:hypothetical protein